MNILDLIANKREAGELSSNEIEWFVNAYANDQLPDYQVSSLLMAICCRGMTDDETLVLTRAMLESGDVLNWSNDSVVVDKHSTGGVGDKTSLFLAPLYAELGLLCPMISGRGLGATGGTLDKLESFDGFQSSLDIADIRNTIDDIGCVICGATPNIAPADRKLYSLRDVTGTVPSIPLITASILSKKLAEGLDGLMLDVKWGTGAFMKSRQDAITLAESLVRVGCALGVPTKARLSDMNQTLGRAAGNAIEVNEAISLMDGEAPDDLRRLCFDLAIETVRMNEPSATYAQTEAKIQSLIDAGHIRERFQRMIEAQGGSWSDQLYVYPAETILAKRSGYLFSCDTEGLGKAIVRMGGGRQVLSDKIDHAVGLTLHVRIGDQINLGDPIVDVHASSRLDSSVRDLIERAFEITDTRPKELELLDLLIQ